MTQEQRKALAEWYGLEHFKWHQDNTYTYIPTHTPFIPDKDMNQLKMLMDRFIEEAKIEKITYTNLHTNYWHLSYLSHILHPIGERDNYTSQGTSISECDLNVLINYLEGLKK